MRDKLSYYFREFTASEKNAGLVLIACTAFSLVIANSNWAESYLHFWHQQTGFTLFGASLNMSIAHWISDGLMTIFFLMVGLEIERELYHGELHPIRKAILPLGGAIGGMLMPAAIYLLINVKSGNTSGFGIPMGTDIAFALAVVAMGGSSIPSSIKIILTAIAIIDDLGSVLVIACFYGSSIQLNYLSASLGIFVLLLLFNRLRVKWPLAYLIPGLVMWFCMMQSGIHPTLAGVLLAFAYPSGDGSHHDPSNRLQHRLHLPVAYLILPLFTLANTAVPLKPEFTSELTKPHALGILGGLMIGKPLGITLSVYLMCKLRWVKLPQGLRLSDIAGMGFIAGVGFTMSVFITQLAFDQEPLIQSSRMMILVASCTAGLAGLLIFRLKHRRTKT